jgi:SAM-dependent methyltransferase
MSPSKGPGKLMKLAHRHPRPSPWWHRPSYADPDYSRRFNETFGQQDRPAGDMIEFFEALAEPDWSLLDIGCGSGDFLMEMARRGVQCTGIDLGPYPIEKAREQSAGENLEIEWICGDMLEEQFENSFDAVTLLGSQMHEFPPDELQRLFEQVDRYLNPGGVFIIEVKPLQESEREYSSYWYLPEQCLYTDKKALVLGENFYYPEENVRVLREYALELKTGRLLVGGSTEKEYQWEEMEDMLSSCGLRLENRYGGWDKRPFTAGDDHVISVIRKDTQENAENLNAGIT